MSGIYKEPQRKRKYRERQSKIFYLRQYKHTEFKSRLYQDAMFYKHGSDRLFIATLSALHETIKFFNDTYGDTLHIRHGVLLLLIKQHQILTGNNEFRSKDLESYFPHVIPFISSFTDFNYNPKVLGQILRDLQHFQFINPIRPGAKSYYPSGRLKAFCVQFDKNIQKYF